jgi:hypothetical protein
MLIEDFQTTQLLAVSSFDGRLYTASQTDKEA